MTVAVTVAVAVNVAVAVAVLIGVWKRLPVPVRLLKKGCQITSLRLYTVLLIQTHAIFLAWILASNIQSLYEGGRKKSGDSS